MTAIYVADDNLVTDGTTTVTALEENSLYPASNLTQLALQPEFRSDGKAAQFDGSSFASITDGSQTGLDLIGNLAIELAFFYRSAGGSAQTLVSKWTSGGGQRSYLLQLANNDELSLRISDDGTVDAGHTDTFITTGLNLQANTYYVVRVRWQGATKACQMTVNGMQVLNTTGTNVASIFNSTATFYLGVAASVAFLDGDIGYVQIGATFSSPISQWRFSNDLTDDIGSNDLTNSGLTYVTRPVGYLEFDFGSLQSPDVVIVDRYCNFSEQSGGSQWLELLVDKSNLDMVDPEVTQAFTVEDGKTLVHRYTAPGNPVQYARLYYASRSPFSGADALAKIHHVYIGNYTEFDKSHEYPNINISKFRVNSANPNAINNLRTYTKSEQAYRVSGNLFAHKGNLKTSGDDFARLLSISEEASKNVPMFWCIEYPTAAYERAYTFFMYWVNAEDFTNQAKIPRNSGSDDGEVWTVQQELRELTIEASQ